MNTQQLTELAQRSTPWPWKWFTSNSHNRLSSVPSGKDGDVISAFKAVDGVACVSVSRADMAFIEAAHPGAVIDLIERLEAAERANAAQDNYINQQQMRIDWLEAANSGLGKALSAARAEVARRDAAAAMEDKWVSVSERMPDNGLTVLVCQEGGITFCAEVEDREFYPDEFPHVPKEGREITHWMDMPEPPAAPSPGL